MSIKNKSDFIAKTSLISSMIIFGTIGIFREYIPLPSGALAMLRGLIGSAFLIIIMLISGKKFDLSAIIKKLPLLILSGALIGLNWILLFESYNYTSVATATLCYYMAPVFVILASPIILKEKITFKKIVCCLFALLGMTFVSGIFNTSFKNINELLGIICGLGAATLYASVIIINKKLGTLAANDRTVFQLAFAGITIIPYVLFSENLGDVKWNAITVVLVLLVGLIHTGFAYTLYFGSITALKAQTAAIFSYIDPVVAIILSAIILNEKLTFFSVLGAILILGATFISEMNFKNKTN